MGETNHEEPIDTLSSSSSDLEGPIVPQLSSSRLRADFRDLSPESNSVVEAKEVRLSQTR